MHYKNTIEAIYVQLDEVQQSIAKLGGENKLRNIDLDLSLSKLRDVYDLILSLQKENKPSNAQTNIVDEVIPATEKKTEQSIENQPSGFGKEKISIEEIKKIITKPAPPKDEMKHDFLGNHFKSEKPTLNEELSSKVSSSDLANRIKNKPITNLSSAIGLNEKFELINTLFNGDKEKYEQTIDTLNKATNFNEAYNYLSTSFQWNMNEPLVQRILELIRRKLIVKKND
jgi:hypothetical protein